MKRHRRLAAVLSLALLAGCEPAATPTPAGPTSVAPSAAAHEPGWSQTVADPVYPEHGNPALDVLSYRLVLAWNPTGRRLTATATLTIRAITAVSELSLDFAPSYTVESSTVDGVAVTATRHGSDLVVPARVAAERRVTLVVAYHGTPQPVPMPSGRGDFTEGVGLRATATGEAWTMQEPFGAFTWYPANDQPSDEATYDITVTVPTGWSAVAQGRLADRTGDTFHWVSAAPVATYLATLAIGRYTAIDDVGPHGLPLTYWIRTGRDEGFLEGIRRTPELLAWLEDHFGPYPFDSAGVVLVDSESAMETQQVVTYGAKLIRNGTTPQDPAVVAEILLHELSHQWFGDAVTPSDWTGLWLSEGWAMYAEWLWTVDHGLDTDHTWETRMRAGDASSRPVAGPPGRPDPNHFGELNVYYGPALMLHAIHQQIGDDAFFSLARDWVQTERDQSVDEDRFIAFVNAHTGRDFTGLIRQWIDSPTTPLG